MAYSSKHLNGNLLCAIDTETTGLRPGHNELVQLAIVPLDPDLSPSKQFGSLEIKVKPELTQNIDPEVDQFNRSLLLECKTHGIERWAAVSIVEEWFQKLRLPFLKSIVPLGCNYSFDRDFITEFMGGPLNYRAMFRNDFRDIQHTAFYINDTHDWVSERIPFPKWSLSYLCSCLRVEQFAKHDALADALATAEVYKKMMLYKDSWSNSPLKATEIPQQAIDELIVELESAPDRVKLVRQFLERTGR